MRNLPCITGAAVLFGVCAFGFPAMAGPGGMGGGHAMGMSGGMGANAAMGNTQMNASASASQQTTTSGGMSSEHMSDQGQANTNGPNATDRDTGLDRSEDRASAEGLKHGKAHRSHTDNDNDADDRAAASSSTGASTSSGSTGAAATTRSTATPH
jgi:hypothetical protein